MSMRDERLRLMGRLQEAKRELKTLRIQADGYVISIRDAINSYDALEDLRTDTALESVKALDDARNKALRLIDEIERMETDLGEEKR